MLPRRFAYILGALALGLIALGLAWHSIFPTTSYWTPQQALEYRDAFRAAHGEQDAASHSGSAVDAEAVKAARERYALLQDQLAAAQKSRERTSNSLVVVGLLLLLGTFAANGLWPKSEEPAG